MLVFDIAQFFLSLNYWLLSLILKKAGFNNHVISFFANYLVDRKTIYFWNNSTSLIFNVNIRVGQGSVLSPILSTLYLFLFLYILEKHLKNLNIPISTISFVDDRLFISQSKSFHTSNCCLFCNYNDITKLLEKFGLIVEYSKTDIFHFNRSHGNFNPPPLNLTPIGGTILWPKNTWKYLGFIFDRKLSFHQHIDFYSNKVMSTVKCMKILGNSNWGINPIQKCLLYRTYILPIVLYRFQLWFYNHAPISYHLKILEKMQKRAAIWILGAFKTSPSFGIEAIVGLIPIKLHLQKLSGRSQLRVHSLLPSHLIWSLITSFHNLSTSHHSASLDSLTGCQWSLIKSHLVDMDNRFNKIFPSFIPLYSELSPGHRIIDNFSDCFVFNLYNKQKENKSHAYQLDNMVIESSSSPATAIVVTDTSIKNDVATSISYTHTHNRPIAKTVHYVVHITRTEAELFVIRCSINQASNCNNISKIIIVTDSIHAAKRIFNPSLHPFQVHSVAILTELRKFFLWHQNNSIEFWECPSCLNWSLHKAVDKETKAFNPILLFPSKTSWDFSKKSECNNILNVWKMTFQASDLKGKQFLDLLDDNNNIIEPSYAKGGSWLKVFGYSNLLCVCTSWAITNHAPIGKYRLKFFSREEFKCPCRSYPIESRHHILHECDRFDRYWNPRRDLLGHVVMFLVANPSAFTFTENIFLSAMSRYCN